MAEDRERLAKYLVNLRKGKITEVEDEMTLMKNLVKELSSFSAAPGIPSHDGSVTVGGSFKGEVVVSLSLDSV